LEGKAELLRDVIPVTGEGAEATKVWNGNEAEDGLVELWRKGFPPNGFACAFPISSLDEDSILYLFDCFSSSSFISS
jgi:hypothetical protein